MMQPFRCPVCDGDGSRTRYSANNVTVEKCGACGSSGIVWGPPEAPVFIPFNYPADPHIHEYDSGGRCIHCGESYSAFTFTTNL